MVQLTRRQAVLRTRAVGYLESARRSQAGRKYQDWGSCIRELLGEANVAPEDIGSTDSELTDLTLEHVFIESLDMLWSAKNPPDLLDLVKSRLRDCVLPDLDIDNQEAVLARLKEFGRNFCVNELAQIHRALRSSDSDRKSILRKIEQVRTIQTRLALSNDSLGLDSDSLDSLRDQCFRPSRHICE